MMITVCAKGGRQMKNQKIQRHKTPRRVACAALMAACLLGLSGCSCSQQEVSSAAQSSAPETSAVSEGSSSLPGAPSRQEESSRPEASSAAETPEEAGSSAPVYDNESRAESGHSQAPVTSDVDFNAAFEGNALDAAYQRDLGQAADTQEMLAVTQTYVEAWKTEVDAAYQALLAAAGEQRRAGIEAAQQSWLEDQPAELEQIRAEAQAAGGSIASLEAATGTMHYYRGRAAGLYAQLYEITGSFALAYAG